MLYPYQLFSRLAVFLACCTFAVGSFDVSLSQAQEQELELGDDSRTTLELQRELNASQAVVEKLPESANAYVNRGMALFAAGKVTESSRISRKQLS